MMSIFIIQIFSTMPYNLSNHTKNCQLFTKHTKYSNLILSVKEQRNKLLVLVIPLNNWPGSEKSKTAARSTFSIDIVDLQPEGASSSLGATQSRVELHCDMPCAAMVGNRDEGKARED